MTVTKITRWKATGKMDEIMEKAREKYVPLIMAGGASSVQMVRTGELSLCVITQYSEDAAAKAAMTDATRAQAAKEFPMVIQSTDEGEVFASG